MSMKTLFVLLIAFATISCGPKIKEGTVTRKLIEPEHYYHYMQPIPMRIGKVTSFMYIPMTGFDDEDYRITLHGHIEGKDIDEDLYVTKETFDKLKLGQQFCIDETCSQEPNEDVAHKEGHN